MTQLPDSVREVLANCAIDDEPDGLNIVLVGGPGDFPDAARFRYANPADEKVKIPHRSGYEHFERTTEHYHLDDECQGLVFRWTTRTRIAE
jgi:hypothetical protein